jgi:GNAT superfamily N-acetyltransferase
MLSGESLKPSATLPTVPDRVTVRRAEPGDVSTVAGLMAEFRDFFDKSEPEDGEILSSVERILASGDAEFLLAEDPEPIGVCQLRYRWSVWTSADDCWLEDLFVREPARGGGAGRALVEAAVASAAERGCKRIELDVNERNAPALALYESCGFSVEAKGPGKSLFAGRALG